MWNQRRAGLAPTAAADTLPTEINSGLVTSTDLARAAGSAAVPASNWELTTVWRQAMVEDVMTKGPLTVSSGVPVEVAARILREHKIGCLPVVEEGMFIGIVT